MTVQRCAEQQSYHSTNKPSQSTSNNQRSLFISSQRKQFLFIDHSLTKELNKQEKSLRNCIAHLKVRLNNKLFKQLINLEKQGPCRHPTPIQPKTRSLPTLTAVIKQHKSTGVLT